MLVRRSGWAAGAIVAGAITIGALALGGAGSAAPGIDPRSGGLEIALGEWTLVPEATAIRPGTVTFVVSNRGKLVHGLRLRAAGESGKGGSRFERRTRELRPGETARLTVDLAAGAYELECFVEDARGDHGDLGMRALLSVDANAAFSSPPKPKPNTVAIRRFAFAPAVLRVERGASVTWTNLDAAPHTVSARSGAFSSRELRKGGVFRRTFPRAGSYPYLCALHPQMKGTVVVR